MLCCELPGVLRATVCECYDEDCAQMSLCDLHRLWIDIRCGKASGRIGSGRPYIVLRKQVKKII